MILIAAFLLFWFVRVDVRPVRSSTAHSKDVTAVARCRGEFHLDEPVTTQFGAGSATPCTATSAPASARTTRCSSMLQRAMWFTMQLIFWGILVSAILSIALGVYSAVRQYSIGDYTFTGLSFIGLAMPPFWFGLMAIEFLGRRSEDVVPPRQPWLLLRRPARQRPDRASTRTTPDISCYRCSR